MSNEASENGGGRAGRRDPRRVAAITTGVVALVLGAAYVLLSGGDAGIPPVSTFTAQHGDLVITVTETGAIEALESQEIRSQIKGEVQILTMVEEGYLVTPQDVEEALVLVQLDSAELEKRSIDQEIAYQNAQALLSEKRAQRDIQVDQNQSNISKAELTAKFALMDFEKFLGQDAASSIVEELELDEKAAEPDEMEAVFGNIDFASYLDAEKLGDGEAKHRLRRLEDESLLAAEERRLAQRQLEEYDREAEAGRIAQEAVDLSRLAVRKQDSRAESARTDLSLYVEHTFPKEAQRLLSEYEMALMNVKRTTRAAAAETTLLDSAVESVEAQSNLQARRLRKLREQVEMCTIRAERPGHVVYASSTERNPWRGSNNDPTHEGATIRERQVIITIPDMTKMGVTVHIREASVQKVAKGQTVTMSIEAFPGRTLTGVVDRVAILADSRNTFMNPDSKVYPTLVRIDGVHDWLRPGMTADVVILIETLKDVIYVPLQSVTYLDDAPVCYVLKDGKPERRDITTGSLTEDFIEVRGGLEQGEEVLLLAPGAGG